MKAGAAAEEEERAEVVAAEENITAHSQPVLCKQDLTLKLD